MFEKCAISTAHRLAFNITGLVGEEEAARQLIDGQPSIEDFDYAEDPTLAARLSQLFAMANEIETDAFRPSKIRLLLRGKTHEEREKVAADLEDWIRAHGGEVPEPVEVVEGEAVEEDGGVEEDEALVDVPPGKFEADEAVTDATGESPEQEQLKVS
jgi:type VI protein secretion system component VasA